MMPPPPRVVATKKAEVVVAAAAAALEGQVRNRGKLERGEDSHMWLTGYVVPYVAAERVSSGENLFNF